jgi:putative membrane protein
MLPLPDNSERERESCDRETARMDALSAPRRGADLGDSLAAERTLLAWIRTGLALMGFGFVVARFGLFLQELPAAQAAPSAQRYGVSLWFGTALMGAGVASNLLAGWHHARLIRIIGPGQAMPPLRHERRPCHIVVPRAGRVRNGDLSDVGPRPRVFPFWKKQGDPYGAE